jgi:hypothetical protein
MRIYASLSVVALIVAMGSAAGRAEDCAAQYSADQKAVYSSLSAANQHILDTEIKNRTGEPVSCDFRRGILDILANYSPEKRDAGFKLLLDKQLNH